ncbi:hypothetical protein D3C78_893090 [compost metagenome]
MEYFSLGHDHRLEAIGSHITFPDQVIQGFEHADDFQVAVVKQGRKPGYSCLIEHPVLLVSDDIYQIFGRFTPHMKSKTVNVLNPNTYSQDTYYMLDVPEIDCLSLTHSIIEKGNIKKLVINEQQVGDKSIFKIKNVIRPSLVVRFDIAEALLRTSLYGLEIQRILSEVGLEYGHGEKGWGK